MVKVEKSESPAGFVYGSGASNERYDALGLLQLTYYFLACIKQGQA